MFSRGDWASWNEDERLLALNELEYQEAISQNRPPADVVSEDMPPNTNGYYNNDLNKIAINSDLLKSDEPDKALETYFHEERHAYQYDQAVNPVEADNPEQAQQWKENFDNYIDPKDDFQGYYNQPVEKDARDYAQQRMEEYNQSQGEGISSGAAGERWSSVDSSQENNEKYHSELTSDSNNYAQGTYAKEDNDYDMYSGIF